jgi:elongation factor Ts
MEIPAAQVKALREKTGVGFMDCKKALEETNGDVEKAIESLRKRGIATAQKKAGRKTSEGVIEAYIHPGSRLGVLLEINCETDFVAKTDVFKELARDLAMQVAAANPHAVQREDIPQEFVDKEMEIYKTQARNEGKPDNIIEKMSKGKLEKYYQEICLLEQSFVKDPNKTVKDYLTECIAKLGENIVVKRFIRFQLGEE